MCILGTVLVVIHGDGACDPSHPLADADMTRVPIPQVHRAGHSTSGAVIMNCISFLQKEALACTMSGDCLGLLGTCGVVSYPDPTARKHYRIMYNER